MPKLTTQDFQKYKNLGLSTVGVNRATEYKNDKGESKKKVVFPKGGWAQFQKKFATRGDIALFVARGSEMIGLITGKLSGIVVIDVDEEHSRKYDFLKTPMRVKSSLSGGIHYYFKWTEGLEEYGNATKVMDYKMDYRGRGGLIFAPGSTVRKLDGKKGTYDCIGEMDLSNFDRSKLPELPAEIILNLKEEKKEVAQGEGYLEKDRKGLSVMPTLYAGSRNTETVRVMGAILGKTDPSLWESFVYPALRIWNHEKVKPPQDEGAFRASFKQIMNKELRKRDVEIMEALGEKIDFKGILFKQLGEQIADTFSSGYKEIDKATGGFRYQNLYLVSGLEKSGKSSWLMNMLQHKLNSGTKIGYVNTEIPILEFSRRMTAYWKNLPYDDVNDEMVVEWGEKFSDKFSYLGVESLGTQKQMIKDISLFVKNVDCLVFDNITSWGNKIVKGKEGWQITADLIDQLLTITKNNKIVTFMVMHMRPDLVVSSTIKANEKAIQDYKDNPNIIFNKSESFVRKPTLADVYGGGSALSQISGAVLIWRPYQKFVSEEMNSHAQIILESFRHSAQASVRFNFDGKTGKFSFSSDEELIEELKPKEKKKKKPKTKNMFGERE